jgi:hypothetical protein
VHFHPIVNQRCEGLIAWHPVRPGVSPGIGFRLFTGLRPSFDFSDGRNTSQFIYCLGSKFSSIHVS